MLKEMRSGARAPLLLLDGGDALFNTTILAGHDSRQARATARAIAAAYDIMGYDAVGVGPYDLAAGADFLLSLTGPGHTPRVSANLVRTADDVPVFPALLMVKRGGLNLAITGLTGKTARPGRGYRLRPWRESLEQVVAEARGKRADMIILLNSMAGLDYHEISRLFPDIRLAIEALPNNTNLDPLIYGRIMRCTIMPRGKHLARLELGGDLRAPWQPDLTRKRDNLLRRLDSISWRLERLRRSRRKVSREYLASLREQKKRTEAELARIDAIMEEPGNGARFRQRTVAVEPETADDPDVLKAVERGKKEILAIKKELEKNRKRRQAEQKNIFRAGYAGWTACSRCHRKQADSWRTSRHAYAYNTLTDKKSSADLRCLPCHVTGVVTGRESYALFLPGRLRAVGCEACHGPGQKHIANPAAAPMDAAAARMACSRCHVPEHDDGFDLDRDLAILNCAGAPS